MSNAAREDADRDSVWTPANIVTVLRICLVPVFVVAVLSPWPIWLFNAPELEAFKPIVATVIFIVLAATDGVDGYLARSRNEVTTFGKFIDPLADKILVAAALLVLVELGVLPSWPVIIILAREFIVSGIRMIAASEGVVIAASWYGKAKTVTQIVAITLFMVKDALLVPVSLENPTNVLYVLAWLVMIAALVLTILSMLDYFSKARHLLGFSKKEGAKDGRSEQADGSLTPEQALSITQNEIEACSTRVLAAARARGVRIATAESLTGGLIASALTAIPGSSDVVAGGVVSYMNDTKEQTLGVKASDLAAVGAVSEEVARSMAQGALRSVPADIAVSVTGIAGPGGGEPGKPVGTVWIAVAYRDTVHAICYHFTGDRDEVRRQTVRRALDTLEETLCSLS